MKMNWECLDQDYCFRASAPLFGNIRVERHGETRPWSINWSVPGYSNTLIEGEWDSSEAAMKAAEDHVFASIMQFLGASDDDGWLPMEDAPTDGTPVQVYATTEGWDGHGVVCAALYGSQWRIYGVINGMPGPDRLDHSVQWLAEVQPKKWRPLTASPKN